MAQPIKRMRVTCLVAAILLLLGCNKSPQTESTGQYMDDTVITSKVKAAIFSDPNLKATDISVETNKGLVMLHGSATSQSDIDHAEQIARGVQGVTTVQSDMSLK